MGAEHKGFVLRRPSVSSQTLNYRKNERILRNVWKPLMPDEVIIESCLFGHGKSLTNVNNCLQTFIDIVQLLTYNGAVSLWSKYDQIVFPNVE